MSKLVSSVTVVDGQISLVLDEAAVEALAEQVIRARLEKGGGFRMPNHREIYDIARDATRQTVREWLERGGAQEQIAEAVTRWLNAREGWVATLLRRYMETP